MAMLEIIFNRDQFNRSLMKFGFLFTNFYIVALFPEDNMNKQFFPGFIADHFWFFQKKFNKFPITLWFGKGKNSCSCYPKNIKFGTTVFNIQGEHNPTSKFAHFLN